MTKNQKNSNTARRGTVPAPEPETVEVADAHAPRKLTRGENAILTIKVLVGFGLLGVVLWAANLWTSAK